MIREFGQSLRFPDAYACRQACPLQDARAHLAPARHQVARHAAHVGEGLVHAVDLEGNAHFLSDRHHACRHGAIQSEIGRKHDDAGALVLPADLEKRLTHLDAQCLRSIRSTYGASIVV
jgi:hypothetical protein